MKVFTNGCFDVLHLGHVELLKYASTFGEVIVGLNSDKSVRRLKGPSRPFNDEQTRLKILESIKYVGSVYIFDEDTPYDLIKLIKPNLIVKGGDYRIDEVVGSDLCEVKIFNILEGHSSSALIESITHSRIEPRQFE